MNIPSADAETQSVSLLSKIRPAYVNYLQDQVQQRGLNIESIEYWMLDRKKITVRGRGLLLCMDTQSNGKGLLIILLVPKEADYF